LECSVLYLPVERVNAGLKSSTTLLLGNAEFFIVWNVNRHGRNADIAREPITATLVVGPQGEQSRSRSISAKVLGSLAP